MSRLMQRLIVVVASLMLVGSVAIGCGESDDSEAEGAEDDLIGAESGGPDAPADDISASCDCETGQFCLVGTCTEIETWSDDDPPGAFEMSAVDIRGGQIHIGFHDRAISQQSQDELALYAVDGDELQLIDNWNTDAAHAGKFHDTGHPEFIESRSGDRPAFVWGQPVGMFTQGDMPDWLPGDTYLNDFAVGWVGDELFQALSHTELSDNHTRIRRPESGQGSLPLVSGTIDKLEIADVDGQAVVLYLDGTALYQATRQLDSWESREIGDISELEMHNPDSVERATAIETEGQTIHMMVFSEARQELSHSDDLETKLEYLQIEDGEIQQRELVSNGEWRDRGTPDDADDVRNVASNIALDAEGNVYVLQTRMTGAGDDGHREAELVKRTPDGSYATGRVSNWLSEDYGYEPFTYGFDVSEKGDVVVAGYEPATGTVHVRLFDAVDGPDGVQ